MINYMEFSLGHRLRATRQRLGLTQEQVIEQLKDCYGVTMSQQALSCIEHGKRKIDAERELPALAAVYGQAIDSFYQSWTLPAVVEAPSVSGGDLQSLTPEEKFHLAIALLHQVFLNS
ncbi:MULTISPECIES: helix-turn-helix domain-containing protein [Oscillatoria]|nr:MULTISPECIES: helix-turn-helix transcriptional regulator [Oscillatoria]